MAGYANGGDGEWNQTSTHAGSWLSDGPKSSPLNGPEIAAIVIIVLLFVVTVFLIFYCRNLQTRRDLDMKNKEQTRAEDVGRPQGEDEGGAIELKDDQESRSQHDVFASSVGGSEVNLVPRPVMASYNLESAQMAKRGLWHYIHWRNPCSNPKPPAKPLRVPEEEEPYLAPTPYYKS